MFIFKPELTEKEREKKRQRQEERERGRERETEIIYWFILQPWPQQPSLGQPKPAGKPGVGNFLQAAHTRGRGPNTCPISTAFPRSLAESRSETGAAGAQAGACVGCWSLP